MPRHPPHPRIPESLRTYICLPRRDSLTLITGVLGATTNWIVLRFIGAALGHGSNGGNAGIGKNVNTSARNAVVNCEIEGSLEEANVKEANGESTVIKVRGKKSCRKDDLHHDGVAVVLVSWMRDLEFWRTEGMKAVVSVSKL